MTAYMHTKAYGNSDINYFPLVSSDLIFFQPVKGILLQVVDVVLFAVVIINVLYLPSQPLHLQFRY